MIPVIARKYRLGEFHAFDGGGRRFLYLVQSAGIFEMDEMSAKLLDRLRDCELAHEDLLAELIGQGISEIEIEVLERAADFGGRFGLFAVRR